MLCGKEGCAAISAEGCGDGDGGDFEADGFVTVFKAFNDMTEEEIALRKQLQQLKVEAERKAKLARF